MEIYMKAVATIQASITIQKRLFKIAKHFLTINILKTYSERHRIEVDDPA